MPNEGGFSASRQPHDAKNLARTDRQRNVRHTDNGVVCLKNFLFGQAPASDGLHGLFGPRPENLPYIADIDGDVVPTRSACLSGPVCHDVMYQSRLFQPPE